MRERMKSRAMILAACVAGFATVATAGAFAAEGDVAAAGAAKFKTDITLIATSLPEAKAKIAESVAIPLLVGEGPLFSGNNLTLTGTAEVSPVSVIGDIDAVWTPVAFCNLFAGAKIGTGWGFAGARGLSFNVPSGMDALAVDKSLAGCVWTVRGGGTLQFDLAALVPGEWTHIVAQSSHEVFYRAFTGANAGESWYWENDDGENRNGLCYYGNLFVGYKMPIALEMFGVLAEGQRFLYGAPGGSAWGDDLVQWYFAPIANFRIGDSISIAALVQFRTRRNSVGGTAAYYYQYRDLDESNPYRVEFYRAGLIATYTIR